MFADDHFDEALLLHEVEAILDLVFVGHEQRPAPLQGDADLHARKATAPAEHDPPHRPTDAAAFEDKHGDGRQATF